MLTRSWAAICQMAKRKKAYAAAPAAAALALCDAPPVRGGMIPRLPNHDEVSEPAADHGEEPARGPQDDRVGGEATADERPELLGAWINAKKNRRADGRPALRAEAADGEAPQFVGADGAGQRAAEDTVEVLFLDHDLFIGAPPARCAPTIDHRTHHKGRGGAPC